MVEPRSSDLVARAEALDERLQESDRFVRDRWEQLEHDLAERQQLVEQEVRARRLRSERIRRLLYVSLAFVFIGAIATFFFSPRWEVILAACWILLGAGVAGFQVLRLPK